MYTGHWEGGRCSNGEIEKSLCSSSEFSKRSYILERTSTLASNQNLIIKVQNLGYVNFSTTAPK